MNGVTRITVQPAHQYGMQVFRPADEQAKRFAEIAGTTTLTRKTLDVVKAMGVQINIIHPEVKL